MEDGGLGWMVLRYLTTWIKNHKILERVSSIKGPSEWFTKQLESWTQTKVEWRKLDRMYRDKKTAAIKEGSKIPVPGIELGTSVGTEGQKEGEEEDVWAAEDIDNVDGEQTPLYGQFEAVDWNLLSLRFELHLLCHSFKKDVSDADVVGIHRSLLGYYYLLYFKKNLTPGICGAKSIDDLLDRLVTDTIMVDDRGVLMAVHEVDTPFSTFVRLTEAARRERQKLIAAGDNSAELVVKNAAESERSEAKSNSGRRRQSGGSRRGPSGGRWISTTSRGGGRAASRPRRSDSSVSLRPAPAGPPASTLPYRPAPVQAHRPRSPAARGPPAHAPSRIDHRPAVPPPQFSVPPAQPRVVAYNRFSASAAAGPPQPTSGPPGRPSFGGNQYNSGYKRAYPSAAPSAPAGAHQQQQQQYYLPNDSPNKRYRGYGEGGAYWERGATSSYGSSNANPSYHYRRFSGGSGPGGPPPPPPQRRY